MTTRTRAWLPLQAAIAWALTRDKKFCSDVTQYARAEQGTFRACLQLEREMIEAGCFDIVNEIETLDPPTCTVEIQTHRLVSGYAGRFRRVAEDYDRRTRQNHMEGTAPMPDGAGSERIRVSLLDYLMGRWHETFREIADQIADEELRARGSAIDGERHLPNGAMPADSALQAMRVDLKGMVWERPQAIGGEPPRCWDEVEVNRDDLLKCFPLNSNPVERGGVEIEGQPEATDGPDQVCWNPTWLSLAPQAARRRGRHKGSGSYESDDEPLLRKMQDMIDKREVVSPEAAARAVACEAKGSGTIDSKTDRLAKRFRSPRNSARNKSD